MQPEPTPTQGEMLTQWGGETVKIVRIEKARDIPLVRGEPRVAHRESSSNWHQLFVCFLMKHYEFFLFEVQNFNRDALMPLFCREENFLHFSTYSVADNILWHVSFLKYV